MGHGLNNVYSLSMSATVSSSNVNVQRAYAKNYLLIPSMVSSSALDLWASVDGTTYYLVRKDVPNTTTVQSWTFTVAATAAANGGIVPIPAGFPYYKIIATDSAPTTTIGFKIICGDS